MTDSPTEEGDPRAPYPTHPTMWDLSTLTLPAPAPGRKTVPVRHLPLTPYTYADRGTFTPRYPPYMTRHNT